MAKSRSIGGIYAELSLRDGKFKAGLKASAVAMKRFGVASAKYAGAGLAAGVAASTAAITAGTIHTLDQVDALGDLSAQTGVAVADMMVMQRAYADGGRAAEMAGKDIGKMQKTLVEAASGGKDPFAAIGLSAQELLKMDPAQQFREIGAAIMRISNPAERTAKAMEIFGKGGMGLTTVFEGLPDAAKALGRMPELAQKFAGAMGEANDLIGHLPIKSDQFFMGFTAGIIGEFLPNLEKIDNFDFTTLGQNLGTAIATGFEGLLDGSILTIISEKFYASLSNAIGATDIGSALSADADILWNDLKDRQRAALEEAAQRSVKEPIQNPIVGLAESAKAADAKPITHKMATVPEPMQVNDYQRRGLSLDANGGMAAKQDKQLDILTQARDLLKQIADTREKRAY